MEDMYRGIKNRKEFFTLLESVNDSNRDYYSKYGNWQQPQIKVFWVEINDEYYNAIFEKLLYKRIEETLYEIIYNEQKYWIDTSDKRIWQIFTFAETHNANQMLKNLITNNKGADRIWLTERFMEKIQKELGYSDRGFGIKFKDLLTEEEPKSNFSAKLWAGRLVTSSQKKLMDVAKENFSLSSIRFGRNESRPKFRSLYSQIVPNGQLCLFANLNIWTPSKRYTR